MSRIEEIIEKFGGIRPMARMLNIDQSAVYRWKERNHVPLRWWKKILEHSKRFKEPIDMEDLSGIKSN